MVRVFAKKVTRANTGEKTKRDKNKFKSIPDVVNKLFVLSYQRASGERIQKHSTEENFAISKMAGLGWEWKTQVLPPTQSPEFLRPFSPTPASKQNKRRVLVKPRVLGMVDIFLIYLGIQAVFVRRFTLFIIQAYLSLIVI
jgi:hypothetical protein